MSTGTESEALTANIRSVRLRGTPGAEHSLAYHRPDATSEARLRGAARLRVISSP